jgi:CRISPR/Cas system-associated exonuclease Cas4 (RecB family)
MKQDTVVMQKQSDVIRASEIGQYCYCSQAWYLQKCGYRPESPQLEIGRQQHTRLGDTLDQVHVLKKRAHHYALIGGLLLGIACILFLLGVTL